MVARKTLAEIKAADHAIIDHITRNGECGTAQIVAALKMTRGFADGRIFDLVERELIHRAPVPIPGSKGHRTVLRLGPAPRQKGREPAIEFTRQVRKTWQPHSVRDPLITALFGPAKTNNNRRAT